MAITKKQILSSYQINLNPPTVTLTLLNNLYEDEILISSMPHVGTYELINNDLEENIKEHFSISMGSILNDSLFEFTEENARLRKSLDDTDRAVTELLNQRDQLIIALNSQQQEIDFLKAQSGGGDVINKQV